MMNDYKIKNILESLKEEVENGKVSLREAAVELHKAGWTNFIDIDATRNLLKKSDMRRATVVSATQIEFNEVSAANFTPHKAASGYLAWRAPQSLTGYAARMQIKDRVDGTVLVSLTSAPGGGITINQTDKAIEIVITDAQTEAIAKAGGVYDLELVSPGGVVTALLAGAVTFESEVTTP
jgi:hypothetical protein